MVIVSIPDLCILSCFVKDKRGGGGGLHHKDTKIPVVKYSPNTTSIGTCHSGVGQSFKVFVKRIFVHFD